MMMAKPVFSIAILLLVQLGFSWCSMRAAVIDDVIIGRTNEANRFELFRHDGTTMQQVAGPNSPLAGIDSGILGMVGTPSGAVVVVRQYNTRFDLLSYNGSALTETNRSGLVGLDDGLLGVIASSSGDVVVSRRYDPAPPQIPGYDVLRYDLDPGPSHSSFPNIAEVNRSVSGIAGIDDGILGMVTAGNDHMVVARHYAGAFDLIRYDLDPSTDNPGFPNIVEANRCNFNQCAGIDDGVLGVVATSGNHVVMARHYDSGTGPQWDLLRYDVAADPIVETNRGTALAGLDDGVLGMVATRDGDVVMIRHYVDGNDDRWDMIRYDVTADPIVELNRQTAIQSLENGFLGVAALGNGGFAIARQGTSGTIDLFGYDGKTLIETGNNLTDSGRPTIGNGFIGMTGFPFIAPPLPCNFNGIDGCDLVDLNLMFSQGDLTDNSTKVPPTDDIFDLVDNNTFNNVIDNEDVDAWLSGAATANALGTPYRRGDTDLDRDVDITDFNTLAVNFRPVATATSHWNGNWDLGNFDGDGDIDITDFNFLAANFAASGYGGTSVVVPEPTALLLVGLGVCGIVVAVCYR